MMAEGVGHEAMNEQVLHAAQQAEANAQELIQQHMQAAQDAAAAAAGASGQAPPAHLFTGLQRYLDALDAGLGSMQLRLPVHSHPPRAFLLLVLGPVHPRTCVQGHGP